MSCASYEEQRHSEIEPTEERFRRKRKNIFCFFIKKNFAVMPEQTRSQSQRNKANRTTHDIPEDFKKLYVEELGDLRKNLGLKPNGGRQALTNRLEQARENHVQSQSVGVTAAMTIHQPSGTASTFSDSQRQEVLDLMKTAISDAAASRGCCISSYKFNPATASSVKQFNNLVGDGNYT